MQYKIDKQFDQVRIDRWLKKNFPSMPQSLIEKYLRNKTILVNDAKVKSSFRLSEGDEVVVKSEIEVSEQKTNYIYKYSSADFAVIKDSIIYEDDDYIVINKPSGFAVQGGSGVKKSIIDILKYNEPNIDYKIVHRLDMETSGILIIAKTYIAARYFGNLFAESEIRKTYLAITDGRPPKDSSTLVNHLLKVNGKVVIDNAGKEAITDYRLISYKNNLSLIELKPITGRMHQLRVQLANIRCPIIGDRKYNNYCRSEDDLALHAYKIEFVDLNKKPVTFKAEIPRIFIPFSQEIL